MTKENKDKENKKESEEEESENKKKIKIISERVNQPFKEIKKEREEESEEEETEEDLESESGREERFEFSGERASPVLQATETGAEPIERSLENVPSTASNRTSREGTGYAVNMPDYTSGNYESTRREEERRIEIRNAHAQRREDILELRQMPQQTAESEAERAEREIRKYQEVRGIKEEEEERRIPGRRREKRERVLKL